MAQKVSVGTEQYSSEKNQIEKLNREKCVNEKQMRKESQKHERSELASLNGITVLT